MSKVEEPEYDYSRYGNLFLHWPNPHYDCCIRHNKSGNIIYRTHSYESDEVWKRFFRFIGAN